MLDYDQTYFGCGNKVPADKLRTLLEEPDYSFLLPDNEISESKGDYIYSTIDTVFPFIDSVDTYARATVLHCANDLIASGITPNQASVSIGISENLDETETKLLFSSINLGLEELGIVSCNYHTYRADQTSITIAVNGSSNKIRVNPKFTQSYDIFLTKPVGVWSTKSSNRRGKISNAHDVLLQSNYPWIEFVQSNFVKYSTDLSGFGLIGHLLPILEEQRYQASISLSSLLGALGELEECQEHHMGCSAKSNFKSFSPYVEFGNDLDNVTLDVLFGGEINGPILMVVDIESLQGVDTSSLIHIGEISPIQSNKDKVIELRD
ncbi:hypothetical protein LZI70_03805 [Vibrio pelagius]|uniref:PurM-like N-terminal domain-containing protein n=1 Tax=Vibrio pelagius TaxID=28169 RepID=A0ABY5G642_VIBPE|nr:AIR synthase related protein [Vibrio pelagius]UTT85415.1 hypothetical protein LZI70_03805 [Vibrio pelagius]